jgi:hypothetical protein
MPKGRDEANPPMEWVRGYDEYVAASALDPRWIKVLENVKVTLNLNDSYGAYAIAQVGGVGVGGDPAALGEQTAVQY